MFGQNVVQTEVEESAVHRGLFRDVILLLVEAIEEVVNPDLENFLTNLIITPESSVLELVTK